MHSRYEEKVKESTAFLQKFFRQPDLNIMDGSVSERQALTEAIQRQITLKEKELRDTNESYETNARSAYLKKKYPYKRMVSSKDGYVYGLERSISFYKAKAKFFGEEKKNLEADLRDLKVAMVVFKV